MAGKKKVAPVKKEEAPTRKSTRGGRGKEEAPPKKDEEAPAKKDKDEAPAKKDEEASAKKGKDEAPAKKDEEAPADEALAKKDEEAPADEALAKKDDEAPPPKDKGETLPAVDKKEDAATVKKEENKKEEEKVDEATLAPAAPPSPGELTPSDRDVILGDEKGGNHRSNVLLKDLVRLHYLMLPKDKKHPKDEKDVEELATRLTTLMLQGKRYELAGLKDVPKPFLKGEGNFLEMKDDRWKKLTEEEAKAFVAKTIISEFKTLAEEKSNAEIDEEVSVLVKTEQNGDKTENEDESDHTAPRPFDVLYLPVDFPEDETMQFEHQTGNKHTLYLASQFVSSETADDSPKRMAAALKLVTSKVEINNGSELIQRRPRHVIQMLVENQNTWHEMERVDLGEFAVIFVFEVYLEKQIHGPPGSSAATPSSGNASANGEESHAVIVDSPTTFDVLFGRGGMTNGHHGNRRFRDIIALHRPDYIRASKMDKPNVARRIVRAIRQGNPPGRFLKKNEQGKWQDVGDRTAAEKTSQGLRERSNAEKRQRSALREALRIRREDLAETPTGENAAKKAKIADPSGMGHLGMVSGYLGVATPSINYAGAIPLSLSMKEKPKEPKAKKAKTKGDTKDAASSSGDVSGESLPPKAKDKDGNILVTDYDILCGRGGLTNHHKGNKRFRDIVALHRPDYVRAPKIQKPSVARVIVRAIRHGDPPGRFIRKDEKTGLWYDIGDKRAAEKTSQALREKTNEEKDRPKSATPFTSPTVFLPTIAAAPTLAAVAPAAATIPVKTDEKGEEANKKGTSETAEKSTESADSKEKKERAEKSEVLAQKPEDDKGDAKVVQDKATKDENGAAEAKKGEGDEKKTDESKVAATDIDTVEV